MVFANADRLGEIAERVLDFDIALGFADQDADGWGVGIGADLAVDGGHVEVELAGVLRLELVDFQFDHDVAVQSQVVEQQIDAVVVTIDFDLVLTANERESCPEFK